MAKIPYTVVRSEPCLLLVEKDGKQYELVLHTAILAVEDLFRQSPDGTPEFQVAATLHASTRVKQ